MSDEGEMSISIDPSEYPLSAVFLSAYSLLDLAAISIEGNPEESIIVRVRKKNLCSQDIRGLFYSRLKEFLEYEESVKETSETRAELINEAVVTSANFVEAQGNIMSHEDPEKILVAWEERYGNSSPNEQ